MKTVTTLFNLFNIGNNVRTCNGWRQLQLCSALLENDTRTWCVQRVANLFPFFHCPKKQHSNKQNSPILFFLDKNAQQKEVSLWFAFALGPKLRIQSICCGESSHSIYWLHFLHGSHPSQERHLYNIERRGFQSNMKSKQNILEDGNFFSAFGAAFLTRIPLD